MGPSDWTFVALAANPFGGLLVAIPFAVFTLRYPAWLIIIVGVPLAYLQVVVVDLAWASLARMAWWRRLIEARRGRLVERLVSSQGFWISFVATPVLGPWFVMAVMRYTRVRQRRVALPILLSLACFSALVIVACAMGLQVFTTRPIR
jgi:hypothetical protein